MAEPIYTVEITMGYSNTDFSRKYTIADVPQSAYANIEAQAISVNDSLASGTDGGLADFFRSDDYDDSNPQQIIGRFNRITDLRSKVQTVNNIPLN